MAGYTRQSVADIINGANITAPPLNAEFNQLQTAFDPTSGHSHDGSAGNSPKINLATSVSGYLLPANGGTGGRSNTTATSNPTTTDDANAGYAPTSVWLNTTTNRLFICVNNTVGSAVWTEGVAISPNNNITPLTSNTVDIGTSTYQFKDIHIDGTGYIDTVSGDALSLSGNASIGGNITLTGNLTQSGNASITGTGYFGGNVTTNSNLTVNGTLNANADTNLGNNTNDTIAFLGRVGTSILPTTDGTYNLGSSSNEWQDLFIDGTAEIDQLNADSVDINNGNIDNTVIGAGTRASGAFTGLTVDGTISFAGATVSNLGNVTTADINGGTIDGVTIGTNSAVTDLRVDNLKVDGSAITSTNANGNIDITPNGTGEVNISKVDIDSGTIDNTVIGATTPAAGTFTTVTTTGQATLATADINGGTIDNTTIGATTPSSGAFTTVSASGGFTGDVTGNVTGNLTGNLSGGNVTGDVTGDLTGNVTASTGTSTFNDVTVNGTLDVTGTTIANVTDPSNAQDAATKNYVDTNDALKVTKAGDTMTGNLTMSGGAKVTGLPTPTANSDAANKSYVDTEVANLVDSAPGTLDTLNELAAALGDDPNFSATISAEIATKLPKAGGTMTGAIAMSTNKITGMGDPSAAQDAATKNYVDTNDALKLNLTGGTMTGDITMGVNQVTTTVNPVSNDDMARKGYVDTQDALKLSLTGGTMSGVINMGSNKVTNVTNPTDAQDAATKNYIDTIFGSTSAAATSAANAATSETNAANSATAASTSETNAAASALAAANSYDDFDDRYLGAKSTAPTVDNDGDALTLGSLYFNTVSDTMQVYGSSGWVPAGSSVNGTSARFKYTATAAQTTFSGNDDNAETLAYDSGYLDVYLNGIRLVNGSDFTATTGTSIQLTTGAAVNDIIEIVAFGTFTLANQSIDDMTDVALGSIADGQFLQWEASNSRFVPATVATDLQADTSPTLGGNLDLNSNDITGTGNINHTGSITTNGQINITTATPILNLTDTDTGVDHQINASSGIGNFAINVDTGGEGSNSGLVFRVGGTGSANEYFRLASNGDARFYDSSSNVLLFVDESGGVVINDSGADKDFRVEGNSQSHLLFVDAGNDRIGINNSIPSHRVDVNGNVRVSSDIYLGSEIIHDGDTDTKMGFGTDDITFTVGNHNALKMTGSTTIFNEDSQDRDFRVESNNNANMLFVDAGADKVSVGTDSGSGTFTVQEDKNALTYVDFTNISTTGATDGAIMRLITSNVAGTGTTSADFVKRKNGQMGIINAETDSSAIMYQTLGATERMRHSSSETSFNESGADIDFRVESSNASHALYVDGATGHVMLNRSSTVGYKLDVLGDVRFERSGASGTHVVFTNSGGNKGTITTDASGTTYNTTSDIRLKTDIQPLADATDKLMSMNPVMHRWKATPEDAPVHGFIAQEINEIVPEAVSKGSDKDEMWSMDYGRITPVLVAALQEAHKKIEALEARINEMEAK